MFCRFAPRTQLADGQVLGLPPTPQALPRFSARSPLTYRKKQADERFFDRYVAVLLHRPGEGQRCIVLRAPLPILGLFLLQLSGHDSHRGDIFQWQKSGLFFVSFMSLRRFAKKRKGTLVGAVLLA